MTRSPTVVARSRVLARAARSSSPRCGGTATASRAAPPAAAARIRDARREPAPAARSTRLVLPGDGEAPCGRRRRRMPRTAVHRQPQEDRGARREDRRLRAVQPGRGVPVEDRVHARSRSTTPTGSSHIDPAADGQSIVTEPNGTGPVQAQGAGTAAPDDRRWPQRRLLGRQGQDPERSISSWSTEARPAAASSSRPAPSTASTTSAPTTSRRSRATRTCSSSPATRPQHLLPRLQQHVRAVRQREGPPGDRHGHRPPAHRRQLLPGRAPRSPTTSPRAPSRSAARATRGTTSTPRRPRQLLADGRLPGRLRDHAPLPRRRPRLPARPDRQSPRTSRRSCKTNLGITPTIDDQESDTLTSTTPTPASSTASSCSAGAPTIRTHQLPRLPLRRRRLAAVRRHSSRTSSRPLTTGGQTADRRRPRAGLRRGQQR